MAGRERLNSSLASSVGVFEPASSPSLSTSSSSSSSSSASASTSTSACRQPVPPTLKNAISGNNDYLVGSNLFEPKS